jgi:cell division septum initiation protein DivIVA
MSDMEKLIERLEKLYRCEPHEGHPAIREAVAALRSLHAKAEKAEAENERLTKARDHYKILAKGRGDRAEKAEAALGLSNDLGYDPKLLTPEACLALQKVNQDLQIEMARLTDRAEKAEAEIEQLRMRLDWYCKEYSRHVVAPALKGEPYDIYQQGREDGAREALKGE